jgi:hypothetical protein
MRRRRGVDPGRDHQRGWKAAATAKHKVDRVLDARGGVVMPGLINVAPSSLFHLRARLYPVTACRRPTSSRSWSGCGGSWTARSSRTMSTTPPSTRCWTAARRLHHPRRSPCVARLPRRQPGPDRTRGARGRVNACLCYEVSDRNVEGAGIEENERFLKKCAARWRPDQVTGLFGLHASMTLGRWHAGALCRCGEAAGLRRACARGRRRSAITR